MLSSIFALGHILQLLLGTSIKQGRSWNFPLELKDHLSAEHVSQIINSLICCQEKCLLPSLECKLSELGFVFSFLVYHQTLEEFLLLIRCSMHIY